MRKLGFFACLALLSCSCVAPAQRDSSETPTAESIVDRYIAARGNAETYKKIKTLAYKGTVEVRRGSKTKEIHLGDRNVKAPFGSITAYLIVEPYLSRVEREVVADEGDYKIIHGDHGNSINVEVKDGSNHKIIEGSDGKTSWKYDSMKVASVKPHSDFDDDVLMSIIRDGNWIPQRAERAKVPTKVSQTKAEGEDCWRVEAKYGTGLKKVNFYSINTGLLLVSELKVGPLTFKTNYGDYRDVDGLSLPFHIAFGAIGNQFVYALTEVKVNADIPMSIFDPPAEVKALMNN
jgi:outer membrane lipoprotein-sorting protein